MKKNSIIIVIAILFIGVFGIAASASGLFSKDDVKKENQPPTIKDQITINEEEHDFGIVSENGGPVSTDFIVKNNMNEPILINKVRASCGCTTPKWTKEPIAPGKTGKITVTYNPQGRPGSFSKTVTIMTSGNPERIVTRIKGVVE